MSVVMNDVLVSEQWLSTLDVESAEVASALAHIRVQNQNAGGAATRGDESAGVTLTELPLAGLLTLRGHANNSSLRSAVQSVLGLELPDTLQSDAKEQAAIRWMTPDEWLVSATVDKLFAIEQDLRKGAGDSVAVVNVTGGYTVLHLGGLHAIDVLKKSTPYDVHPGNFPSGKVVNTTFAKSQATIRALENGYELIVRRSFADYVWMWLHVAAQEYGLAASP